MDYKIFYEKISSPFQNNKNSIIVSNRVLTYLFYALYPVLLLLSLHKAYLWKLIIIPGISFVVLSFVRNKINKARPYEDWDIHPIIYKDTKGNSMPSRHIFSSVMISMCYVMAYPVIGIILLFVSIVSACIRVIGGVHYPIDVTAGYIVGIVAGIIMFLI